MEFAELPDRIDPIFPHAKDPDEKLDYSFDFGPLLGSAVIDTCDVTSDNDALIIANPIKDATGKIVSCYASGGVDKTFYVLTFKAKIADGRNWERSVRLRVEQR